MSQNVSSVRVQIIGDSRGLNAELQKSSKNVQTFGQQANRSLSTVTQATGAFGLKSSQSAMAVSQLGFAVEDAVTVFGTTGLAGSLRAAGNNLSFVAAMMNPIAGLAVGIGTALAGVLVGGLSSATRETNDLGNALESLEATARDAFIELHGGLDKLALNAPETLDLSVNVAEFDAQQKEFEKNVKSLQNQLKVERMRTGAALGQFRLDLPTKADDKGLFTPGFGLNPASIQQLETTLREGMQRSIDAGNFIDLTESFEDAKAEIQRLQTGLPEAQTIGVGALDEARKELFRITREQILLNRETEQYNAALKESRRLESIRGGIIDPASNILSSVGERFKLFKKETQEREEEARNRRIAIAQSDPLQAGFQFGSVEAISAINRATFSRPNPTEKEIEKNTKDTAGSTEETVRELKRLGQGISDLFRPAIAAGGPL